jgi:hypothetical protein
VLLLCRYALLRLLLLVSGRPVVLIPGDGSALALEGRDPVNIAEPQAVETVLTTSVITGYALETFLKPGFIAGTAIAGEATTYVYVAGPGNTRESLISFPSDSPGS